MTWLNSVLPAGINYWAILCALLAGAWIFEYARKHKLSGLLDHFKTHGIAPDGKVIVSAATVAQDAPAPRFTRLNLPLSEGSFHMKTIVLSEAACAELQFALNSAGVQTGANDWNHGPTQGPTIDPPNLPTPDPYNPPGIFAVMMQVGTPDQYQRAAKALGGDQGYRSRIINANANADPWWTGALAQLVAGKTVDEAYAIVMKEPKFKAEPTFDKEQLAAALSAFFSLPPA